MRARLTAYWEWFLAWLCWKSWTAKRLPFGIEVVGFSEEEGVRFGTPFIGSRALVGRLDEDLLSGKDKDGISVRAGHRRVWA